MRKLSLHRRWCGRARVRLVREHLPGGPHRGRSPPAAAPAPTAAPAPAANPLLARWTGPYGGVPPFDKVKVEHFKPALEAAMAENRREIDAIADNPAAPTFENTIAALEDAGRPLSDVDTVYGVWASTMNGPEFQAVEREMAPKLAAFDDEITQNEKLFAAHRGGLRVAARRRS